MKSIGGYFELELKKGSGHYHDTPYALKSGRSSLHLILNFVKPTCVFIPYYTCDALLEPFLAANVSYRFYEINEKLEPDTLPELQHGEYFLYVNYLDLKRDVVSVLSEKYRDRLLVDCTQAFFMKGNGVSWFFNSGRKFFGLPDGSNLYTPADMAIEIPTDRNTDFETAHLIKRFNGYPNDGFNCFQENEVLAGKGVYAMSRLSEYLLSNINFEEAAEKRRLNYTYLSEQFADINLMDATMDAMAVPMSFPLLLNKFVDKTPLFAKNIFIPTFWKDTQSRTKNGFDFEKDLTDRLWPLPMDHRYNIEDMARLCSLVKSIL